MIPIIIIFASLFIGYLRLFLKDRAKAGVSRFVADLIVLLVFLMAIKGNFVNSFLAARWYSQKPTLLQAQEWLTKNLPSGVTFGSNYAQFSSSRQDLTAKSLPSVGEAFSYQELLKEGYDYVAVNISSLHTNYLIWWMKQNSATSLKFWDEPYNLLSQDYRVLALRELFWSHSLSEFLTGWQAPGYNFGIFNISDKNGCEDVGYSNILNNSDFSWTALSFFSDNESNLVDKDGVISIAEGNIKPGTVRWQTGYFSVKPGRCYKVQGRVSFNKEISKKNRGAFIRIDFYSEKPVADIESRPIISFVSERAYGKAFFNYDFSAISPREASYAVIGFQVDDQVSDFTLEDISVQES
ncbi:MAG: hypothetical protein COU27_01525, partial [Candidatus Levybacteria bacterium CG10_big_fil_rev_8_21_14_0_10_36_7]